MDLPGCSAQRGSGKTSVRSARFVLALAVLTLGGCANPFWRPGPVPPIRSGPVDPPAAASAPAAVEPAFALDRSEADRKALLEVFAQIETLGALEPQAKRQLMDDLRQTPSSLWPGMVHQFRAALAYRRQLEQRQQLAADQDAEAVVPAVGERQVAAAPVSKPGRPPAKLQPVGTTAPSPRRLPGTSPTEYLPARPGVLPDGRSADSDPAGPATPAGPLPADPSLAFVSDQQPSPAGAAAGPVARQATSNGSHNVSQVPLPPAAEPANHTAAAAAPQNWQGHLDVAISLLEQETKDTPQHADEVGRHAALRMLYLVAGQRENALKPIEGVPIAQQDFWTKQLYSLASCLEDVDPSGAGQRACRAHRHLQEAADKLGELATLEVGNLALCTEVSSFGAYKPFDALRFTPGQEVLLYAEINNFRSESTEKGYCTALRSSYEILDEQGHRVDRREFAVTEDYCRNRRHDFFMRYFVTLPARIYPGTYTLRLTIEDVKSNKIGQSSIKFEIEDDAS
ncbi:MAG: hypothetical protein BMS9Abin04_444 [Planctomycetia bacterium]|nr:MAG: hypothetical protein BMS9Abin04_444 [Planctomycetia bacterium]